MSRQKIVLVNLPSPAGITVNREGVGGLGNRYLMAKGFLYPPHAIAAVAGQLRHLGHRVKVIDCANRSCDSSAVISVLNATRPDVVGIHLSYAALNWDMALTNFIAQGLQKSRTVVFGPVMNFDARLVQAQTAADAILVGEPEFLFPKVLSSLPEGPGLRQGIIYFAREELTSEVNVEGFANDLDGLSPPAWDLCGIKDGRVSVMASRGCSRECIYCPYVLAQGHCFRPRSPRSVVEEIRWSIRTSGASQVIFRDPAFAAQRQRVVEICELILRLGIDFTWECESRPEHFDTGLLGLMKRAGCQEVKVGLETADANLLARLGRIKGKDAAADYLEHVRHLIHASQVIGLRLRVFVMHGLPGESQRSLDDTEAYVESLKPRALNVKAFEHYPGFRTMALSTGQVSNAERLLRLRDQIEGRMDSRSKAHGTSSLHMLKRVAGRLRGPAKRLWA